MSLKKYLIKKRAQASIEYIILMVVLMGLLMVWLGTGGLFPNLRDNLKTNFFDKAVVKILDDGAEPPPPPPPVTCFAKGTKITLADGSVKPINEIKVGDMVLGYNGKEAEPVKVAQTFLHPKMRGYLIVTTQENTEIKVTANHPVFTGKDFKPAGELKVGDEVFILNSKKLKPTVISSIIKKDEAVVLYNLKIARLHNFFAEGLLCHNKPPADDDDDE